MICIQLKDESFFMPKFLGKKAVEEENVGNVISKKL